MKNPINLIYLALLYIAMAIISGVLIVYGAKPMLIKKKLFIGSIILSLIVFNTKKTQAQVDCYKTSIVKSDTNEIKTIHQTFKKDTVSFPMCYIGIEEQPAYPGGNDSCLNFIKNNLQYPINAKQNNIQGTVYVRFVVEADSSLTEIKVIRGIGYGCDEEAIRIIKLMPKWISGKQNGKAVRAFYTLPIAFILNK